MVETLDERQAEIEMQRKALLEAAKMARAEIGYNAAATIVYLLDLNGFEITKKQPAS
jgi:acetyl/propionyl-CoA carboxylase alpha subunit